MKLEDFKNDLKKILNKEFDFSEITEEKVQEASLTAGYLFELNKIFKQLNELDILSVNDDNIKKTLELLNGTNQIN